MCSQLFDFDFKDAVEAKRKWLESYSFYIRDHILLTVLLHELTALVKDQVVKDPATPTFLTHQGFLGVLDKALQAVWPCSDKVKPFTMPDGPSQYWASEVNQKKHEAEDDLESDRPSLIQSSLG